MLAASLILDGGQTLIGGQNYNTSDPMYPGIESTDDGFHQAEMSIVVDPTNPLNIAGISHRIDPTTLARPEIDLLFSNDGGLACGRLALFEAFYRL